MTSRSKIVGINRDSAEAIEPETEAPLELGAAQVEGREPAVDKDETPEEPHLEEDKEQYFDEEAYLEAETGPRNWTMVVIGFVLAILFAAWTGFFTWSQLQVFQTTPTNMDIISMLGAWALPVSLIGVIWLLAMRNSRAESDRFADASAKLRAESEALETRMRTVNEEIALAREFLSQNAQDLESVGRQSSEKLKLAAEQLGIALADSDGKAKQLEEVSNAAASNLKQLRKHLPVVTSAAKDVSNQIGSAGNNAQDQIISLRDALNEMRSSGQEASDKIAALEKQATEASNSITQTLVDGSQKFVGELANADSASDKMAEKLKTLSKDSVTMVNRASRKLSTRVDETATKLDKKLSAINSGLETATEHTSDAIMKAAGNLDELLSTNNTKLTAQIDKVDKMVIDMQANVDGQGEHFNAMVSQISDQIDASRKQIEALDSGATEKTSNLAFAIETLVQSTKHLDEQVVGSNTGAEELVAQAERLTELLAKANKDVTEGLPSAIAAIEEKITANFAMLDKTRGASREIDENSQALLGRTEQIDKVIAMQHDAVDRLLASSDEQMTSQHEQAAALSKSLEQTHALVDSLTKQSSGELLQSIERIRDTAEDAVARSKSLIEEELGSVAGRLSEQNKSLLENAVESQLSNISDRMQGSIMSQLTLSQGATDKLTSQLAEIDQMTSNLEKRVEDTRSGFGGLDHEGFARRMTLLTESLNSTAIDVAKILSNDIADTAWSSYLKGDRGVFTRRAVKLLDSGEARIIAEHYETDSEFSEHVNRYIHDFEAMMRVLLSTRDGNAIGVTILSSDVGKLYVALAQAIERLRN